MKNDGNDGENHQSSHCHPHHSQVPDDGPNLNPDQKLLILAVETDYRHQTLAVEVFPEECGHPLSMLWLPRWSAIRTRSWRRGVVTCRRTRRRRGGVISGRVSWICPILRTRSWRWWVVIGVGVVLVVNRLGGRRRRRRVGHVVLRPVVWVMGCMGIIVNLIFKAKSFSLRVWVLGSRTRSRPASARL